VGVSRPRRLQLDEHIEFVQKSWRVERVATWFLVAILIAAVAGLLGSGPLSGGETGTGRLRVEYPRLSRYQSSERLVIHAAPARAGELRLWLDRGYLEGVRIETMVPPPLRAETAGDRVIFVFAVADAVSPFALHVRLQPERIGVLHGRVGLEGAGDPVAFRQLVYP
jgi:hypothetical protein